MFGIVPFSVISAADFVGLRLVIVQGEALARFARKSIRVFVGCSTVIGLATLWLPLADGTAGVVAFAALYGLAYGGNGALLSPLTADLFGRGNINAVFGLVSMAFAISGLIAPAGAGAAYDAFGTYDPAFLVTGLAAIVGAGAVAAAGRLA